MPLIIEIIIVGAVALINLTLAVLVFTRNPKSTINRYYSLMAFFYFLWPIALSLYEFPLILSRLFWIKATYMMAVGYFYFLLLFSFEFPTVIYPKAKRLAVFYLLFYTAFSAFLLYFTNWWVVDVVVPPGGHQTILNTIGYTIWIFFTWIVMLWAAINLITKAKTASASQKVQLKLFWIGFILFGIAVTIFDGIIPLVWHDTSLFFISAVSNLFFSGAVGYAIIKHRLLDIRLVVARSLSYGLLLLILGVFYAGGLFLVGSLITREQTSTPNTITSTALALIIAYTFQPLRIWLEKITDRIFFKERYDTEDLLHALSTTMATTLTLSTLSYKVLEILIHEMRLAKASFAILQKKKVYILELNHEKHIQITMPEIEKLNQGGKMQIFDELEDGPVKEIMRKYDISLALPLSTQKHFIGFLFLGEKASGDIYFDQDIDFLTILGPELSVAIQNSQRFEEISQFNITLQEEVKRATGELREANIKLTEIDKQKDEFISIASHDLRSPLSVIKNYLWLIESNKAKVPRSVMESVLEATKSTERAITLVNDMLDVSRIEMGRFEVKPMRMNITKLAGEIASGLTPTAKEKGIKLEVVAHDDYFVKADKDRIAQVFGNLIGNALKFTPQKGEITVNFEKMPGKLSTSVTNTGPGIKKEDLPKLFTKFGRLDNSLSSVSVNPGTGLGLYISKRIMDMHGGEISVKSEVGKGATFTFTLPVAGNKTSN